MSVVTTQASVQVDTRLLSDYELAIKLNQDATLALAQEASNAQVAGNTDLLNYYHQMSIQLEQELKQLELEYSAVKTRIETEVKMRGDAIKRSFTVNI